MSKVVTGFKSADDRPTVNFTSLWGTIRLIRVILMLGCYRLSFVLLGPQAISYRIVAKNPLLIQDRC